MKDSGDPLGLPLTAFSGVGPRRAERLAQLGLGTVRDLLVLMPRGIERQGRRLTARDACAAIGSDVSVVGRLKAPRIFRSGWRRSTVSAELVDDSGKIRTLFFNQPWMIKELRSLVEEDAEVELYGRVVETASGRALAAPRMGTPSRPLPAPGTVLPVYALTEGLGQEFLRRLVRDAVARYSADLADLVPSDALARLDLPDLATAIVEVHGPTSEERFLPARRRLALERLLVLQAHLASSARAARGSARALRATPQEKRRLIDGLPHTPTGAQRRVMDEVARDLARTRPMRRLLQGDVGSGKTLVALHAAALVARSGGQTALLVPTELLAEQHHAGLAPRLFEVGVRAVLLTGSLSGPERRRAGEELASGRAQLAIGTHALLSEGVAFGRLDLAIIDEQQRFGVAQKQELLEKGSDVHVLLMTATPIPRTLALCVYADMDTSILDEKPPGRGEISTHFASRAERGKLLAFVERRMAQGERVYWICPRIDGEEGSSGAEDAFARLSSEPLARHGIELVHGKLPADERARRIERFRRGDSCLLVGTTIVEVGVDVPEATVMVIAQAERFGLAQLHQLRGRVGRGVRRSWCVLATEEAERDRLRILAETNDGFAVAEEDLRRRGMGDLAGLRQAGHDVEGLGDPITDLELVLFARRVVRADPRLASRYRALGTGVEPALV